MTRPFKVSPKTALTGAALATEVRHTYPLSARDEHALRSAVQNILVKRLSRGTASDKIARNFDVDKAAVALGVTPAQLQRKLANQGKGSNSRDQPRSRVLSKKKAGSKARLVSSRRGKARHTSRSHARVRG